MDQLSPQLSAEEAIEHIGTIETEEALAAFVPAQEKRKTVLAAVDARYAELIAPADEEEASTSEEADHTPPATPHSPQGETIEASEEDDDEFVAAFEDEVIIVASEEFATVIAAVTNKLESERSRFSNGVLPEEDVTAKMSAACKALEKAAIETVDGDRDAVELPVHMVGSFALCLQHQLSADQQRRGLSQPSAIDQALIDLLDGLTTEIL